MKASDLRSRNREDLTALLREQMGRIDDLRFLAAAKKIKNVKEIAGVKKDVARIRTILNQAPHA